MRISLTLEVSRDRAAWCLTMPDKKHDDSAIPQWIKDDRDQEELKAAKKEADTQRQLLAKKTVEADGPVFWKQLLKELKITTDSLPAIHLSGSLAGIEAAYPTDEEKWHIEVRLAGLVPIDTYTNIFYKPGGLFIRCHTQEGEAINLQLCTKDGLVCARHADGGPAMDAEQCAQAIVQPMKRKVRPDDL